MTGTGPDRDRSRLRRHPAVATVLLGLVAVLGVAVASGALLAFVVEAVGLGLPRDTSPRPARLLGWAVLAVVAVGLPGALTLLVAPRRSRWVLALVWGAAVLLVLSLLGLGLGLT